MLKPRKQCSTVPEDEQINVQFRQVLEVPITDFELSVRSRKLLEAHELENARRPHPRHPANNFWPVRTSAETSLDEIEKIMVQKNLRIGQSIETGQQMEQRYRPQSNLSPEEQAQMGKPVSELNLSVRARKCMNRLNIANARRPLFHAAKTSCLKPKTSASRR